MDSPFLNMNQQNPLSLLEQSELGQYLSQEELAILSKHSKVKAFSSGDTILKQGEKSTCIFIVIEGNVRVIAGIMGQGTTDIETLSSGSFIGDIGFIEKVSSPTSILASTAVQCLELDTIHFEWLSVYYPEIKYKLLKALSSQVCDRLKHMHDKVVRYICGTQMTSLSFLGKVVHTLKQPKQITFETAKLDQKTLLNKPIFQLFNAEEQAFLFSYMHLLDASKNCKLIHEGEKKASCFIVLLGAVQSSIVYNSKLAKLSVIGPGTLFAGVACVDKDFSYTINFSTCEQAILLKISDSVLDRIKQEKPQLWYKLFSLICASLVALEKSIDKLDIRLHIEAYNR